MRECAKLGCRESAIATVGLRYQERVVWVADLLEQRDPNLIDLCAGHADRLVAPYGWSRLDERLKVPAEQPARLEALVEVVEAEQEAAPVVEPPARAWQ